MKSHDTSCKSAARRLLAAILGTTTLFMPVQSQAASVVLATAPLASSTSISVKPNLVFVLDDSGSMAWDHMPDDDSDGGSAVSFKYGHYGVRSSQCNQVYYDPTITYIPPIKADGVTSYSNSSFSAAWVNGFNTVAGATNLRTSFKADLDGLTTADTAQTAYYFSYSGSQNTPLQKNYHSTTSTFYNECNSANKSSTGEAVFTKVVITDAATSTTAKLTLECSSCTSTSVSSIKIDGVELMSAASTANSSTSTAATNIAARITLNGFSASASSNVVTITGLPVSASSIVVTKTSGNMSFSPTIFQEADATKKTNFANWYSYYRTRMLMMKTAAGHAFKTLDNKYRIGLMKISSSTPVVYVNTFEGAHRTAWYDSLYGMAVSGATPLRLALSNAGRYYAGKLTGTDPIQYSCQQNFTILSTDGYWNSGAPVDINDNAFPAEDNQDATASRPMYDGAVASGNINVTINYTRNDYSRCRTNTCGSGQQSYMIQPQQGSCVKTVTGTPTGSETCSPTNWGNIGAATYSNCSSSCTRPSPNPSTRVELSRAETTDTTTTGGSKTVNSLADIAMYYYQTDLRHPDLGNCIGAISGENVCTDNVFTSSTDNNLKQHMTTFTLGMGASGRMNYANCYLADNCAGNEDYTAVKFGGTANSSASPPICSWQANGSVCNWPIPGMNSNNDGLISNIDDLWHAAVNGRGAYFAATNPTSLSSGLSNALTGLNARRGSAAAAATSTLNPTQNNNYAYVASYTTVSWKGNLEARGINTETGVVSENASWCVENVVAGTCSPPGSIVPETDGDVTVSYCVTPNATICPNGILDGSNCKVQMATACTGTMSSRVSDTSNPRIIYTSNGTARTFFDTDYATAYPTYFSESYLNSRSPRLSQWDTLTATQKTAASGANLVNFLRGRYEYEDRSSNAEDNRIFRYREAVLGDALESQPAYLGPPVFNYPYPLYTAFRNDNANRVGTVYMGANDGMLHAFDSNSGVERWAYVPSMVVPNLWKLADKNYSILHANYVNGSPITTDFFNGTSWRTILVGGLNGGGRGYYALDITEPSNPILLWELTTSGSGITGAKVIVDDDMGYGFGQAVVTRKVDGTWVVLVTSGYNNSGPGDGKGYLYVLNPATGAILSKISTGVGSSASPSGLARIAGWNDEPAGNQVGYVYGGDLEGNVWRFDVNAGTVMKFAELKNGSGNPQPITTTPTLGKTPDNKRIVFIGTGKYLETGDLTTTQTQSFYAIKDDDATTTLTRGELLPQPLAPSTSGAPTRTGGTSDDNAFSTTRGWYVDFPDEGERVNIDSKLVQGTLLVATTVPSNTACSPGGYGWLNFFDYLTGNAVNPTFSTVVSSRYESPIVGINVLFIDGNPIASVVTSTNPTPTRDDRVVFKPSAPLFTGKRVTWRELIP